MSILTPVQKLIFDQISKSPFIRSNFYFTGGTALSEFYLKHRFSEDLDFFSEKKFEIDQVRREVSLWTKELNFSYKSQQKGFTYFFFFKFKNNKSIKVDFGYYPPQRVEKGKIYKKITIDSLLDIAINKFAAIHQRSASKDIADLYFLLKKFTIWDLIEGAKIKFHMETDPWILSSDLLFATKDINTLPRMIKRVTLYELKNFFLQLALKLGKKAIR
ncbi:hypothetical protein A2W14_07160 [Candidatus Gottesmanbacteria bacterium RBG_16_37_8]|uniref:Nucleotidyl transferase AbiEii/AbiGii toxin family protein n=1 Tax=Candidatus Gottesmanbacteria bacterium RBG_16_37_8 TaxID=1798371 RepID=A0A1F5YN66_9BACT|nr:MAG: hypothetical protein A2W14_07160 [Candidatus Gottesmanbacteria bacterium RBG_16_37_8]